MTDYLRLCRGILIVTAVTIYCPIRTVAAQEEWTWTDRDCKTRTLAELHRILAQGSPADLSGAILKDAPLNNMTLVRVNLKKADLRRAHLSHAQIFGADLTETQLAGADLTNARVSKSKLNKANLEEEHIILGDCSQDGNRVGIEPPNILNIPNISKILANAAKVFQSGRAENNGPAKMTGANLESTDLTEAHLHSVDLSGSDLKSATLSRAVLSSAKLVKSNLTSADLTDSNLSSADLSQAVLENANLRGANLSTANLKTANIIATQLRGADLDKAKLDGAFFEPKSLPDPSSVATASGLDLITYSTSPAALSSLRAQFQSGAFRDQERQVTYALMHTDALIRRKNCLAQTSLNDCATYAFNTILFDWTSLYGKSPGRPILILAVVGSVMAVLYFLCMHFSNHAGIWLVKSGPRGQRMHRVGVSTTLAPASKSYFSRIRLRVRREWRLARAAMFFSLISAFNIGYQELNVGQWLSMLTNREYQLKATGWARTAAGFQSLISVYLLALWVLTHFGHPFAQ